MRDRLAAIFNALQNVQTKGESTLIVADCIRELLSIIQQLDEQKGDEDESHKEDF